MWTFTCPNPDCENHGIPIKLDWDTILEANQEQGIASSVTCVCGNDITSTGVRVDADPTADPTIDPDGAP